MTEVRRITAFTILLGLFVAAPAYAQSVNFSCSFNGCGSNIPELCPCNLNQTSCSADLSGYGASCGVTISQLQAAIPLSGNCLGGGTWSCSITGISGCSNSSPSSSANGLFQTFGLGGAVNGFGTTNPLDTDVGQPFWSETYSDAIQNWINEYENQIQSYPVMNQQVAESPTSIKYQQQAFDPCADSDDPDHCVDMRGSGTTPALLQQPDTSGPYPSPTPSPVDCAGLENGIIQAQTIMAQIQNTTQQLTGLQQQAQAAGDAQNQESTKIADEAMNDLSVDAALSGPAELIKNAPFLQGIAQALHGGAALDPGEAELAEKVADLNEKFQKGYEYIEGAYDAWKGGTATGQGISNGVSGPAASSVSQQFVSAVQNIVVDPGLAVDLGAKYLDEIVGPGMGMLAKFDLAMSNADLHLAEANVEYGVAASLQNSMDSMNQTYGAQWMLAGQAQQQLQTAQAAGQCAGYDSQGLNATPTNVYSVPQGSGGSQDSGGSQ